MRKARTLDRTSRPAAARQHSLSATELDQFAGTSIFPRQSTPAASAWSKTDLSSVAVHELKTPLATISGQMQLARKVMAKDPARARGALDVGLQQVERMTQLIGGLQNELRLKADATRLDVVTFDLCAAVRKAIIRHEHEVAPRFRLDAPNEGIRVRADPKRCAQILDNLLNNALKFSPAGAPVDVAVTLVGSEAQVRVEDYGIGVAAEDRERMFAAYYRTPRAWGIPGSGLGLHISRRLAEQQGGHLWLDDSTDVGSVFALSLPVAG